VLLRSRPTDPAAAPSWSTATWKGLALIGAFIYILKMNAGPPVTTEFVNPKV